MAFCSCKNVVTTFTCGHSEMKPSYATLCSLHNAPSRDTEYWKTVAGVGINPKNGAAYWKDEVEPGWDLYMISFTDKLSKTIAERREMELALPRKHVKSEDECRPCSRRRMFYGCHAQVQKLNELKRTRAQARRKRWSEESISELTKQIGDIEYFMKVSKENFDEIEPPQPLHCIDGNGPHLAPGPQLEGWNIKGGWTKDLDLDHGDNGDDSFMDDDE